MNITILGSGDAFGSGGRFNSCLHVEAGGERMLLDCGASSLVALNKAGLERNGISTLLFTHFHGDHFGGLPAFLLDAQFVSRRKEPLVIAGPLGVEHRALHALDADFPGAATNAWRFPIRYVEVTPESPAPLAGIDVTAFPMVHDERAGPCQGYRLAHGGKVFAFSGDTAWTEALVPLAAGADVLLVECYTWDVKLANHLDYETLASHRAELKTARIVLTHMGVSMLAHREPLPEERAHDGMVIAL
ncbi:Ribonuclease BN, tRNA processing enzyme [Bosea sp. OK403]|jgi:ribonuclease BN (tRNA processing enzyme)|uniref:MBL fold metallo-hydrolase n=1 Tax=Bosea sp. OK403 TaxID=1855286 RepID=UPI0008E9147D|nr:MBL fold metallo-hydrolase [Bosea sp. OK403]SFI85203.1 Ribonuclease BN, tRNA processing enzyme [Bosea sp. OK403]